jgi:hypothetical protein
VDFAHCGQRELLQHNDALWRGGSLVDASEGEFAQPFGVYRRVRPQFFWAVLSDGTLLTKGMPKFETMTREQAEQLRAYIRAGARATLATQQNGANAVGHTGQRPSDAADKTSDHHADSRFQTDYSH